MVDLRGKDFHGLELPRTVIPAGADLREADLSGADLKLVDLRGSDLRGADLRGARNVALVELVGCLHGEWIPLAAWDGSTRFPEEFEEKLWTLGLRFPGHGRLEPDVARARRCGLEEATRRPLDKTLPGWREVIPYASRDG